MHEATEKDVDIAVAAARKAFETTWRKVTPEQRGKYLVKLADLVEKNLEILAAVESLDNGKAFTMAKGDVAAVAGCLRYYGGWADKIEGKVIDTNHETFSYTKQEPVSFTCGFMLAVIINSLLDWRLRPNYSLEFPLAHVGMEDWSRYCLWKHSYSKDS